jgi:hypothetical protein
MWKGERLIEATILAYILSSPSVCAFYRGLMGKDVPAWYLQHMDALATGLSVILIIVFAWRVIKLLLEI